MGKVLSLCSGKCVYVQVDKQNEPYIDHRTESAMLAAVAMELADDENENPESILDHRVEV